MLRGAGDFKNRTVVEYATLDVHIKNRLLPVNLRHAHYESDADFVVTLGVSPTGRLTNKGVYLDSVELAEEFAEHLTSVFDKRKYKSNYEIKVVVRKSTCTKTVTRHKIADSQKVREYLAK
ncbi:hypothetical protein [Photobacterium leiognathi]|uniref:hypothetical protein n=1 Tax=Photobacterium leiognathi TaxID=553611 RepID=UPI0029810158|nr:hypothetical protein [Photobacterium leiognathi]